MPAYVKSTVRNTINCFFCILNMEEKRRKKFVFRMKKSFLAIKSEKNTLQNKLTMLYYGKSAIFFEAQNILRRKKR